jgi:hypothetical protein
VQVDGNIEQRINKSHPLQSIPFWIRMIILLDFLHEKLTKEESDREGVRVSAGERC